MKKLSSRQDATRCPECNKYGSPKYGGRCRICFEKMSKETKNAPFLRSSFTTPFGEGFSDKKWHPEEYGIIKEGFDIAK